MPRNRSGLAIFEMVGLEIILAGNLEIQPVSGPAGQMGKPGSGMVGNQA